jgi:diketogulonate reductase-like aldo/keto reductase
MELTQDTRLPLKGAGSIPTIGLGVWKMAEGRETKEAVRSALELGYRHIDTARLYANERSVGEAVRGFMADTQVPRDDIFVTTKLWPSDYDEPMMGFTESFDKLGLGHIDLYLIHWPVPSIPKAVWQALEEARRRGLVRAIGVSNYGPRELDELLDYATVMPMVNQIEFNPRDRDLKTLAYCQERGIIVEAYSPLGRGSLLRDRTVAAIAQRHEKTPAQILIRWCLEHGTVPLPKSSNPKRQQENFEVFGFTLTPEDMAVLDAIGA